MVLSKSKYANPNYLAKIVKLTNVRKHDNADKLQITSVEFNDVIVSLDANIGDYYVYFPLECKINDSFLSFTNSFKHKELNSDKEKTGFFEDSGRVRAVKLRGEKSCGYLVPLFELEAFSNCDLKEFINEEFDTINDVLLCEKYQIRTKEPNIGGVKIKKHHISRLIDGQFRFHIDTENLKRNIQKINPEDNITISYKLHGTSFIVSNLLVKKKLNLFYKLIKLIGIDIKDTEYDILYSSRRVVKNEYETRNTGHFYEEDLWGKVKEDIKEFIPKGFSIYGEIVGFTSGGSCIQQDYDYGCQDNKYSIYIYRITTTNEDGRFIDLSSQQIKEFCDRFNLNYVPVFYSGLAKDLFPELSTEQHWHQEFIKKLEETYTDKDCFMCKNNVPEEGIVLRKESLFNFEAYKLKSFRFLERETKLLDGDIVDMESSN